MLNTIPKLFSIKTKSHCIFKPEAGENIYRPQTVCQEHPSMTEQAAGPNKTFRPLIWRKVSYYYTQVMC